MKIFWIVLAVIVVAGFVVGWYFCAGPGHK